MGMAALNGFAASVLGTIAGEVAIAALGVLGTAPGLAGCFSKSMAAFCAHQRNSDLAVERAADAANEDTCNDERLAEIRQALNADDIAEVEWKPRANKQSTKQSLVGSDSDV